MKLIKRNFSVIYAIKNAIIFTVNEKNNVFRLGTIVWTKDRITAVGLSEKIAIPEDATVIDGKGRLAVLPGLIDAHSHSSLLKGFSENLDLLQWLGEYQREHQVLTEKDAYYAALISYLEAVKGGTTCVLDMYRYMHRCAEAAGDLGIRVFLAPYVSDHPVKNFFETLETNERLINTHHQSQHGRVQVMVGLEHLFYCSEPAYHKARSLSDHYDVMIHTHSSELEDEVTAVVQHFGQRPVSIFKKRGILTPKTIIAHAVFLNDEELKIMADHNVGISHCPTSNAKLAGGCIRFKEIKKLGLKMGLGSDGSISNNSLSLWESMKFASLIQKAQTHEADILPAPEVLRMATIDGAKLLGCDDEIGSLEIGKKADIITVDLWQPHLLPIEPSTEHDPVIWNLIYSARASDVTNVWVDGRHIVKNKTSVLLNEEDILSTVHSQTCDLLKRREQTKDIKMVS